MQTLKPENKITLVGAGLAGSLLSIYLAKRGVQVDIYERRPDMRQVKIRAGRSINMALSVRGIHALREVGLRETIMQKTIPMKGRVMHSLEGELSFHPYGKDDSEVIYSISRGLLNMTLMDEAEKHEGVTLYFNKKCTGLNFRTGELNIRDESTNSDLNISVNTVIGTDGSASAIRMDMLRRGRFNLSQQYIEHGYKELTIPPGPGGQFLLEKNALHIWPRGSYMLIALPNLDGSFTCTLFFPFEGENSFQSLSNEKKVLDFFQTQFPDAVPLMPTLLQDFFANPTGALVTIKCHPWYVDDKVALLGDAAHAIVPFFGQGMNCAFEDCTYLDKCIEEYGTDWKTVFHEYEKLRRINTSAIQDMALENFVEMRDRVADTRFLLKKEVELALEKRYPNKFIPRYSMVSFHRVPYSVALSRGVIQERILNELCHAIHRVEELDWQKADTLIKTNLQNIPESS